MATLKSEDSPADINNAPSDCLDPFDIEQYINTENLTFASPAMSPNLNSEKSPTVDSTSQPQPSNNGGAANSNSTAGANQIFARPSHNYEEYKQQSSLPPGAVANTLLMNQPNDGAYAQGQYGVFPPPPPMAISVNHTRSSTDTAVITTITTSTHSDVSTPPLTSTRLQCSPCHRP